MKNLLSIAAVVCAFALHASEPKSIPLFDGINQVNACGEIVGVQCMTAGENQSVTAKVVCAVTEVTNAYKSVNVPHTRYDFTITNYDGNASIATNTLDKFSYADWTTNVSWIGSVVTNTTPWTTNWVYRDTLIVGAVKPVATNILTSVLDGTRVKATYTKELPIGNGNASSHYLQITPASTMYFYGGRIDVQCGNQDNVHILIK